MKLQDRDTVIESGPDPVQARAQVPSQPAPDYLPDPEACLLTGILPQTCLERGLPEHAFADLIEHEMAQPGTVGVAAGPEVAIMAESRMTNMITQDIVLDCVDLSGTTRQLDAELAYDAGARMPR